MNSISQLNEIAQKTSLPVPEYSFTNVGLEWQCHATFNEQTCHSTFFATKKAAKENAAKLLLSIYDPPKEEKCNIKNAIILLDGDQRADCWKWLANSELDESVIVYNFISPTTPLVDANKRITLIYSKTTNRDSSDALLLITLGSILESKRHKKNITANIILVSSDHIIVQAAQDFNCLWAANLKQLKML